MFSKEEKEARAHANEGNVQQVISVCFLWEFHSGIWSRCGSVIPSLSPFC